MKHTKKIISAILLSGVLMGCTPANKNTETSNSTGTNQTTAAAAGEDAENNGGTSTPGEATKDPVITQAIDPDIILAEGDGILITSGDVEKEFEKMLDSLRAEYSPEMVDSAIGTLQNEKANILEQYLRNELLSKKGEELGIELESEEAVAKYDEILKGNITNFGGQEKFDEVLAQAGYTAESYREDVLNSLRYEAVAEEVTKDITVSEDEVATEYEEVKATTFTEQPNATLYHIFFGDPEEVEDAEAKAKEAKQKLDDGTPFAELAKEYGQDGTADKGGLLGDFPYQNQQLAPDFMNEAYKLEEGEVSEPVKTTFGWHLIKAENVQKEPKVLGLTDRITLENGQEILVNENIRMNILNSKRKARLDELFAQWETTWNVKKYVDKIPMNVEVEEPNEESNEESTQP
jgi:foldase protein PrsA